MAQVGFPWQTQQPQADSSVLSEKRDLSTVANPKASGALKDATNSRSPPVRPVDEKQMQNGSTKRRSDSIKASASIRSAMRSQVEPTRPREPVRRPVARTIPPWIQDAEEEDLNELDDELPHGPNAALVAQHNHSPSSVQRPLLGGETRGRPNARYSTSSGRTRSEPTSRWASFARASAYPRENFNNEKVDPEWLNENFTDYSKPWLADHNDDDVEDGSSKYRAFRKKRRVWYKRAHFAIMRNPFVPLAFRVTVIVFAVAAMALGASIFHENHVIDDCINQHPGSRTASCASVVGQGPVTYSADPSALMAIIVDAIAIVYTVYITYDEYFSKPLGLRPAGAKVRLVLLDLFFICFQSANLSLAFNSLTIAAGPCRNGGEEITALRFDNVCDRAEALSSVLIVSLVAWLLTFSVSILRLVERIGAR